MKRSGKITSFFFKKNKTEIDDNINSENHDDKVEENLEEHTSQAVPDSSTLNTSQSNSYNFLYNMTDSSDNDDFDASYNLRNMTEDDESEDFDATKPFRFKKPSVDTSTQTTEEFDLNKFMERLKELLQSGQFSDLTLNVKGKKFRVHKNILAAHSPVFAAMMEHDLKEKATGIVNIEDLEPNIFADFLHCIYSGNTQNLNSENVVDLYTLADKYQIMELRKICVRYMTNHISLDTFCDIMALSLQYQEKELTEVATEYFLKNSIDISKTEKWLIFLKENVVAGNELFMKSLQATKQ